MKPKMIFYFSSTHWDREWYLTVDEFRFRLVSVMDNILDTLENTPEFSIFTLDGQTSPLEDYLAVRGEKRPLLERLIREGRLVIGPWYTMPDEFLTSGESIIQNLLAGHRIAEKYQADTLKAGYVCDIFGHIANLPQILNGFGIDNALISRGTNDSEVECFFSWKSPDGSKVLTFKTPEICGYGSFFFETMCQFGSDYEKHLDEITELAISYVNRELERTSLTYVILMDGFDHEYIHPFMPEVLKRLSDHFGCPVVQERLDKISATITEDLPQIQGELNSHCKENIMHSAVIPHTLSARYDLKRANDACQNILEHYSMPCAAIEQIREQDPIYSFIDYAYSLLLQNHAHDSICGCSVDAVHREMHTRFEKAYRTANDYVRRFCLAEAQRSKVSDGEVIVKLFNPLPYEYQGLLEFDIDFPVNFTSRNLPNVKYEQRNAFFIFDEQGNELPYNIMSASYKNHIRRFAHSKQVDTHRVALNATLRPMSFTSFTIRPSQKPYRIMERFSTGPNSCENAYIQFRINPDGTVCITDKETGYRFDNLHSFLDCGEIGDGWYHIRPIRDRVISSLGCKVTIEKTFDGYAACKFLVRYDWSLPKRAQEKMGFKERCREYDSCIIESEFTISRTSKLVTVHTVVHNNIEDHRMQLHLPTHVSAPVYHVNQCNLILERKTGLATDHYDWKEADITEYSFENMAFIKEESHGLLFLSGGGLHEISCPGDADNSMDITLLRCFGTTVDTNGEPDGQLLGKQEFSYALLPIAGESHKELVQIKDRFVTGYRAFTIDNGKGQNPESAFTLQSENCAYITCMPSRRRGIIIRLVNYSDKSDMCMLNFAQKITGARLCDYLETPYEEALTQDNCVTIQVPPYKMVNLHVEF